MKRREMTKMYHVMYNGMRFAGKMETLLARTEILGSFFKLEDAIFAANVFATKHCGGFNDKKLEIFNYTDVLLVKNPLKHDVLGSIYISESFLNEISENF